jgi:hypothetical protein
MRLRIVVVVGIVLSAGLAAGQEAPAPLDLPVSLDRIREALAEPQKPSLLDALDRQAHFRVEVEEKRPTFAPIFSPDAFKGGPVPPGGLYAYEQQQRLFPNSTPALVSFDTLPVFRDLLGAFREARRARAAAAAREEVERSMAEFCAAQPNGGKGVVGCGDNR